MFLVLLPQYFHDVFEMTVDTGSSLSMLPFAVSVLVLPLGGWLADLMMEKNILSRTNVRKLFHCCGFGGEVGMVLVLFFTKDWVVATAALTVASCGSALAETSYSTIRLDMAPRYSAILHGVSNGIGQTAGTTNIRGFQFPMRCWNMGHGHAFVN